MIKLIRSLILSIAIIMIIVISGCQSVEVCSTKCWEGHYKSEAEFYEKTKDIKLERGESIWVLSNRSLSRVLKQQGK